MSRLSSADLGALFLITANRTERTGSPGGFAVDKLIPVASGATGAVHRGTAGTHYVDYTIDNCPFAVPLTVEVKLVGPRWTGAVGVAQVAGPRPITLTGPTPDASGVDFAVARFPPVR